MRANYIIGIIGAGNMGEALIRGLLKSQLVRPYEILASRRNTKKLHLLEKTYGIHCTTSNEEVVKMCPTVVLAVKPQTIGQVMAEIKPSINASHLIISIAAGIDISTLKAGLGSKVNLVRAMPNLPSIIDKGVTAIHCRNNVQERYKRFAHQIFQAVGTTVDIRDENLMDVVTALSGSGPAYFFAMMEAMRSGAISMGLTPKIADSLVRATAAGAAELTIQTGSEPQDLRRRVTSEKGTTWAAMSVFEKNNFWKTIEEAMSAAARRAKDLRLGK